MRALHYPYKKLDELSVLAGISQYPKSDFKRDAKGKMVFEKDGSYKNIHREKTLLEIEKVIEIPKDIKTTLLLDLQTSMDCYCADTFELFDCKYVSLFGSGWAEHGFPFCRTDKDGNDASRNIENEEYGFYNEEMTEYMYGSSYGYYLLLGGKTAEKFLKVVGPKGNHYPHFKQCFSGNLEDFSIPKWMR